jgi:MYXO-CTERM domain-containing protein
MLKLNRSSSVAALLATLGVCAVSVAAQADTAAVGPVILNTATMLAVESANGPATKPVGKQTGSGVVDTQIAFDNATGDIVTLWTQSVVPNGQSGVQGAFGIQKLTEAGLQNVKPLNMLPTLKGERTFMRPAVALGKDFVLMIGASEDNGNQGGNNSNGNPQPVAFVADRSGNLLKILNNTRPDATKPTNLITLSGQQDGQQNGTHSICSLGVQADGSESFLMGLQRNNQQARVLAVNVAMQNGGVKVTVPYLKTVVQNAQHCRPQIACPVNGALGSTAVIASVEANGQPADKGVRAIVIDTKTGNTIASKLIAASNPGQNIYAVSPSAAYISDSVVGIEWTKAQASRTNNNNGNGHAKGGSQLSMLTTLSVSADKNTALAKLDEVERPAPYNRHAAAFGTMYGAGAGVPAVAVLGASSTGLGKGLVQMVPVDAVTGKIGAIDPTAMYEVSKLSDVANPGYGKATGFMPEVKTFNISAVAGLKDLTTANRDSLYVSLFPATWDQAVATTPGTATPIADIPAGPSPRAPSPTTPSTPTTPAGGGDPFGNSGDSTGSTDGTGSTGGTKAAGYGDAPQSAGGCSVSTTATSSSSFGGLALAGLGLALMSVRRKFSKKEQ